MNRKVKRSAPKLKAYLEHGGVWIFDVDYSENIKLTRKLAEERVQIFLKGPQTKTPGIAPLSGASTPQEHTCCLGVENRQVSVWRTRRVSAEMNADLLLRICVRIYNILVRTIIHSCIYIKVGREGNKHCVWEPFP